MQGQYSGGSLRYQEEENVMAGEGPQIAAY